MGDLRLKMYTELRLRNYSEKTIKRYILSVAQFSKYFQVSPEVLGPPEIKKYLKYLIDEKGNSWSHYRQTVCGLRFLYTKVLGQEWLAEHIPFPRRDRPLPSFLTKEEVAQVFGAVTDHRHLTMMEVLYGTGVRTSELMNLKVNDIDSKRKVIKVVAGKGGKDRYTLLSDSLLIKLRKYWRVYRPSHWLFEGRNGPAATTVIQKACRRAEEESGVGKRVTPHILRHSFATALLEQGVDLVTIGNLLGHSRIKTTALYTHVTLSKIQNTSCPLENLE